MKPFLTVMQGRKFIISALIALTTIWLIGPYLAIAGKVPLASLVNKIIASIAITLFFLTLEYRRSNQDNISNPLLPDDIKQELQTLQKKHYFSIESA